MYCPNCGYQAKDTDKFCANCGKPLENPERVQFVDAIEEEPQPARHRKKKKGCFSRLSSAFVWMCVLFVVMAIVGAKMQSDNKSANLSTTGIISSTSTPQKQTQKPNATPKHTATPTAKPTSTPTVKPTETPTPTAKVDKAALVATAKGVLEESASVFSYCNVEGDETGFIVSVAFDGLASELARYQEMGKDVNEEGWQTVKKNVVFAYNRARSLLDGLGLSDSVLMMNLLNDNNHDYTLLSVYDGQIVYDFSSN